MWQGRRGLLSQRPAMRKEERLLVAFPCVVWVGLKRRSRQSEPKSSVRAAFRQELGKRRRDQAVGKRRQLLWRGLAGGLRGARARLAGFEFGVWVTASSTIFFVHAICEEGESLASLRATCTAQTAQGRPPNSLVLALQCMRPGLANRAAINTCTLLRVAMSRGSCSSGAMEVAKSAAAIGLGKIAHEAACPRGSTCNTSLGCDARQRVRAA